MQKATFKYWTLTTLDDAFGLLQIWECSLLAEWQNSEVEINDFEETSLLLVFYCFNRQ